MFISDYFYGVNLLVGILFLFGGAGVNPSTAKVFFFPSLLIALCLDLLSCMYLLPELLGGEAAAGDNLGGATIPGPTRGTEIGVLGESLRMSRSSLSSPMEIRSLVLPGSYSNLPFPKGLRPVLGLIKSLSPSCCVLPVGLGFIGEGEVPRAPRAGSSCSFVVEGILIPQLSPNKDFP